MFEKLTDPKDVTIIEGRVPIRHRYTPGVAGEAFFRALKERGRFVASSCSSCGVTYCPPRLFCERCFEGPLEADIEVGPQGVLESFSVGYTGVEGEPLEEPMTVGLVRLEGADTVILHFVLDGDGLEIGQRVEPVFVPAKRRTGSMLDIQGFRPVRAKPRRG